jgi:hypothetical protein
LTPFFNNISQPFRQFCRGLLSGRNKSVERRITDRYGFESFIRDVFSYFLEDVKKYFNKTASQDIREAIRSANDDDYQGLVAREVMYREILGKSVKNVFGKKHADLCFWNKRDRILHVVELKILRDSSIASVISDKSKLELLGLSCSVPCMRVFWLVVLCKGSTKKSNVDNLTKLKVNGWRIAYVEYFKAVSVVILRRSIL